MPHATRRDQTLRAAARDFAYYLLRDLRDPVRPFVDIGGGSIPTDRGYFSGRAAGSEIACVGSIPYGRETAKPTCCCLSLLRSSWACTSCPWQSF